MEQCKRCGGDGWYVVLGHDPYCDCMDGNTTCPIAVQEQCENCRGTGRIEVPDVQE